MADTSYAYFDLESVSGPGFWEQPLHAVEAKLQARLARIELMKKLDEVRESLSFTRSKLTLEYATTSPPTLPAYSELPVEMKEVDNIERDDENTSEMNGFVKANADLKVIAGDVLDGATVKDNQFDGEGNRCLVAHNMLDEMPVLETPLFVDPFAHKLFDKMSVKSNIMDFINSALLEGGGGIDSEFIIDLGGLPLIFTNRGVECLECFCNGHVLVFDRGKFVAIFTEGLQQRLQEANEKPGLELGVALQRKFMGIESKVSRLLMQSSYR